MAVQLDLEPKPFLMLVQGVIFIAGFWLINNLMLKPYLKLRDKRLALTTGRQSDALQTIKECERLATQINDRLLAVADEEKAERDRIRDFAMKERASIVSSAEAAARTQYESVAERVRTKLQEERQRLPGLVQSLTKDVYQAVIQ